MKQRIAPPRSRGSFGRIDAKQRLEADHFFAELMGRRVGARSMPARTVGLGPEQWLDPESSWSEAVPLGGHGTFRHAPLDRGSDPNVEARWNLDATTRAGTTVDIVVHLHGYGRPASDFLATKATLAGVDMVDGSGTVTVRASRPTLALIPRGTHGSGRRWTFPRLATVATFDALVTAGLSWLASTVLGLPTGSTLARGRLTLMVHSGGGAGMNTLLDAGLDPHELVCYDSTYGSHRAISGWATRHIAATDAGSHALRVFYRPCSAGSWSQNDAGEWRLSGTEVNARRIEHAVGRALAALPTGRTLAPRYRVDRTTVAHNSIPAAYSAALLDDITATASTMHAPPPASTRPGCAANSDWLTRPPRRPRS